jgi:hydrogenase small subunit
MKKQPTLGDQLRERGISRRTFLKLCAVTTSMMALPPAMIPRVAKALEKAPRPSVIYLSFQECTGCLESLTRSHDPTLESLIFNSISLDYNDTLQAASGTAAEAARNEAMKKFYGKYLLIVDGSVPMKDNGIYSTAAGRTNIETLKEVAAGAAAVISVGTCAAFGGIPLAKPNPTGAVPISELVKDKPVVNVSGCPPIPVVITGVLAHYLTFGELPALDSLGRPVAFYGDSIHDRCYRRPFYDQGKFAESFDDEGARNGWCLFRLGCKGPTTHNACATTKWNGGVSFPIESGHPCLGCSEPDFWDGGGFYRALSMTTAPVGAVIGGAAAAGAVGGAALGAAGRRKRAVAKREHHAVTADELKKKKEEQS